jgi:hypothetical protein
MLRLDKYLIYEKCKIIVNYNMNYFIKNNIIGA